MKKLILTIAATMTIAAAVSGCGSASGNPETATKPDQSVKAADSLTSVLETNSTGAVGFTSGQAGCVAEGFVEQFGVEGLQEMGLLDEELQPGHPTGGFKLSPVEASGAADATLACVNASDFITNLINSGGGSGGLDEATVNCVADDLGETGTHDLLVAAFEGDQTALQDVLMPAAFACTMG
jgi:hypothetical protein